MCLYAYIGNKTQNLNNTTKKGPKFKVLTAFKQSFYYKDCFLKLSNNLKIFSRATVL